MEFITAPLVVGIIFYSVYKLFELVIRRQERLLFIEKLNPNADNVNFKLPDLTNSSNFGRFLTLRLSCISLGLALGVIVALLIVSNILSIDESRIQVVGPIFISSLMLFGGLGMLASFIVETKLSKKDNEDKKE